MTHKSSTIRRDMTIVSHSRSTPTLTAAWLLVRETFNQWQTDKAPTLGAALAYYTVFSLAPLLVIALAVAAFFFGEDAASGEMQTQLQGLLGDEGATAVESLLASAKQPESGIWASILGVATLLFGASGVFGQLQQSLNTVWRVPTEKGGGLWRTIRLRFLSFTMVLGIGFLLLVSLVVSAVLSGITTSVGLGTDARSVFAQAVNVAVSMATITFLFAMIFKMLPEVRISWRDVWLGALVTAGLFTLGKQLIGMYLGRASIGSAYGAAGSVVIVLLWAYYSAQILLFGAEFTRAYSVHFGSHRKGRDY
jgi:membrane protein